MDSLKEMRERRLSLAKAVRQKKRLYLDTKFWIALSNAQKGRFEHPSVARILDVLQRLVASGKVICPLSEITFSEIFKNRDKVARNSVVATIDELSEGVTVAPFFERLGNEFQLFFDTFSRAPVIGDAADFAWTKAPFLMGNILLQHKGGDDEKTNLIQGEFDRHLFQMKLGDLIAISPDAEMTESGPWKGLAERMNEQRADNAGDGASKEQVYRAELHGLANELSEQILEAFVRSNPASQVEIASSEEVKNEMGSQLATVVANAFLSPLPLPRNVLRTMHIYATIHANVRRNSQRLYRANDFNDFKHASAALGYCDAFFTERSLATLCNQSGLSKEYGCKVISDYDEALSLLEEWESMDSLTESDAK